MSGPRQRLSVILSDYNEELSLEGQVFDRIRISSRFFFINTEILATATRKGFRLLEIGVRSRRQLRFVFRKGLAYLFPAKR